MGYGLCASPGSMTGAQHHKKTKFGFRTYFFFINDVRTPVSPHHPFPLCFQCTIIPLSHPPLQLSIIHRASSPHILHPTMLALLAPCLLLQAICSGRRCCANYQVATPTGCLENELGAACEHPNCPPADYLSLGASAIRGQVTIREGMAAWADLPGSQIHNIPRHMLDNPALFLGLEMRHLEGTVPCAPGLVCEVFLSFYECGDCPNKDAGFPAIAARDGWKKMPCQMRFTTGSGSLTHHRLVTYRVTGATLGPVTRIVIPAGVGLGFITFVNGADCVSYNEATCNSVNICRWDAGAGQCSVGYCAAPRGPVLNEKCSSHGCAYDDPALL